MKSTCCRRRTHGFAAISALFLLVVLSALGAYLLSLSNTQQITAAQDVLGVRAYWAAKAGIEWGAANANTGCPAGPSQFNLDGFVVRVTCTVSAFQDGADTIRVLAFTAMASNAAAVGSTSYVERSLTGSLVMN